MENILNFLNTLKNDPMFVLFIAVGTGLLIGTIKVKGISLGISGVFISGLILGLCNMMAPKDLMNYGLLTFIYVLRIQ
ncbi:MAG: YidE/YbjL duplication, partial [bacterium]|nr:YidE/YbjL duplication [bacterium]